ncbi:MAG: class I SAM-dependent methyltransferase [Spirochaetales bacterium]|nr:class I SAM-dependent methyltransferase [Spirochaetales bacterium]
MDKNPEQQNQLFWDEVAPVHLASYNIRMLKENGSLIDEIQLREMGEVKNRKMLHLQCHIGTDTLSWAYHGACMTGVDFSAKSIEIARGLANELNIDARFIHSNIFELPRYHNEKYDIVYTSQGVLCWIKDIDKWAEIIRFYVKDDGFFYIMDSHPFCLLFNEQKSGIPEVHYPYFSNRRDPIHFPAGDTDYSDSGYTIKNDTYEWTWTTGDILNSLIKAGMKIIYFHEYNKLFFKGLPDMIQKDDGWWYLPGYEDKIPFIFTLKAVPDI